MTKARLKKIELLLLDKKPSFTFGPLPEMKYDANGKVYFDLDFDFFQSEEFNQIRNQLKTNFKRQ